MKRSNEQIKYESNFSDPIKIKEQRELDQPKDGMKSPWDYRCPQYDQRSSNFVNAGTYYGSGINQPVGHEGNPKQRVPCMPFGKPQTMRDDEKG